MAEALKAEGNKLFAEKKFDEAIDKFTKAIELDSSNHVLYSNRSGAYTSLKKFSQASNDANKVIELKPDWAKGWGRKGAALHGQGDLEGAREAYSKALELEPSNAQAKAGLDAVTRAIEAEAKGGNDPLGGMANMFNDPQLYQKIASNPKTSSFLADPKFMEKLERVRKNPQSIAQEMMSGQDQRLLTVMGVLLGVDMQFGAPGSGDDSGTSNPKEAEEDISMPDVRSNEASKSDEPDKQAKAKPEPEPEPEDEESKAKKEAKAKADEEKRLGTEKYKKREFDAAIEHYNKAWEIHKDITYLNNLGAAKFEKGDYDGAIKACEQAVNEGREMLADFKLIAKAFARIGTTYEKMGDLPKAIENYQKSLTEHRTPDVLAKLRAAEKAKITVEKNAYIDPEKAEEARELGSQRFKAADWPGAVESYSEMIRRAPDDPRGYSNRAACFIKLLSFPSAIQDCDEAIKRDPKFMRAYLRKAQAYHAMREYSKCVEVCEEAMEHDENGTSMRELEQQQQKAMQAQYSAREGETEEQTMERISKDPEIVGILQDPIMQSILQQAKGDPAALQEHMKNPSVKSKIFRLINAGVIRLGR